MAIQYFIVGEKTVFIPLRNVYPECVELLKPHPQMFPLRCLREDGCPANMGCMDILAKRVNYLFQEVVSDKAELLITYFKYENPETKNSSLYGGVFNKDLSEPSVMVLNPWGFQKFQREGVVFEWEPTDEYRNFGVSRDIIPVKSLLR